MSKQTDLLNLTDAITVDGSNNVGIGTDTPEYALDVNGPVNASYFVVGGQILVTPKQVFSASWFGSPAVSYVNIKLPYMSGSGSSRYYYYDVYAQEDIGNISSQVHYKMYIHVRSTGATVNALDVETINFALSGKSLEFYYDRIESDSTNIIIRFGEDYSSVSIVATPFASSLSSDVDITHVVGEPAFDGVLAVRTIAYV